MSRAYDAVRAPDPTIKTRAELLQRLRDSPRPAPQPELLPRDELTTQIKREAFEGHTERIKELRETLGAAQEGFETDFALKPKHGKARADFGRSC